MFRMLFLMMLIYGCSQIDGYFAAKSLTLGFYPDEYNGYTREDWDSMKMEIGSLRYITDIADLEDGSKPYLHVWFLLNRLPEIEWTSEDRKAVSSYLDELALAIFYGKKYEEDIQLDSYCGLGGMVDRLSQYPLVLIWAALQIDPPTGFKTCEKIFSTKGEVSDEFWMDSRSKLLNFLTQYFKEDGLVDFAKKITPLNKKEEDALNKILFNNSVFHSASQVVAWQKIWEDFEKNNVAAPKVATISNAYAWRNYNLLMLDIYETPSIELVLDIADSTATPAKKYIFLSAACFLSNDRMSTKEGAALDEKVFERIKSSVVRFYQNERIQMDSNALEFDFLVKSYEVMIAKCQ